MHTTTEAVPGLGHPVPVLRIFDEGLATRFYQDYLGFTLMWEHRFEDGLPLYRRVCRDQVLLDLSEHHGDGAPGTVVWVPVADVLALHAELTATTYSAQLPAVESEAPGGPTLSVTDPFGNLLRFCHFTTRGR